MELTKRLQRQREVVRALDVRSDDDLRAAAGSSVTWTAWAGQQQLLVEGVPLFVKRLPLTEPELDAPGSTRNHFGLPDFYNYGVGSAGFGAYRELAAHKAGSHLVESSATAGFPLLYHHRVLPRVEQPPPFPIERSRYLAMWNDNERVAACGDARAAATHELWIISEHIPRVVQGWHAQHLERTSELLRELRAIATAFNAAGFLHLDASYNNVLTDGHSFFLCDFGLALSSHFELTEPERAFFDAHQHYDHAEIIWSLTLPLRSMWRHLPEERRAGLDGIDAAAPKFLHALLENLDAVAERLAFPADYTATLSRYREPILAMDDFVRAISQPHKTARFDDGLLAHLIGRADAA